MIHLMAVVGVRLGQFGDWLDGHLNVFFDKLYKEQRKIRQEIRK